MEDIIDFKFEKVKASSIMVVGVGGGGGNAVNHMVDLGISNVTFMVCNTDRQALEQSLAPIKLQLGEGLGAGNNPDRGKNATLQSLEKITAVFEQEGTRMVFITAGLGGGTGTGGAPIIAKAAKGMGILTVAIVSMPFKNEGKIRTEHAKKGLSELRNNVDALIVINPEKIREMYGDLPIRDAFGKADDILAQAARGISEIIEVDGFVNVDFEDVRTTMQDGGLTMVGSAVASGEDRAIKVAEMCMNSPLLDHNYIKGATKMLVNIISGKKGASLNEQNTIIEYAQKLSGQEANIIYGIANKSTLADDEIEVTFIAAQFGRDINDNILGSDYTYISSTIHPEDVQPQTDINTQPLEEILEKESAFEPRERLVEKPPVSTVGSMVIKLKDNSLYQDLDAILSVPAYLRRNVELVEDRQAKSRPARVAKQDLQGDNPNEPKEIDLFNT